MKAITILLIALALIAMPALADIPPTDGEIKEWYADPGATINGNSYDNSPLYVNKCAQPPRTENEIQSMTTGSLYVSMSAGGCLDADSRTFVIVAYYGDYFSEQQVGVNGKWDGRLESGRYLVRLAKGTGSSKDQNTWKAEEQEVTIIPGQPAYVTFIGSGSSCGIRGAEPAPASQQCPEIGKIWTDTKHTHIGFTLLNDGDPQMVKVLFTSTARYCIPGTWCREPSVWSNQWGSYYYALPGSSTHYSWIYKPFWIPGNAQWEVTAEVDSCRGCSKESTA